MVDNKDVSPGSVSGTTHGKGAEKMQRLLLIGIVLLAGCQSIQGPFAGRTPERVDDPYFSIAEQQRRGRERLALPDDSRTAGPNSGLAPSDPTGR